ncbi:hypothetical protein GWI33_003444 [Rhynchophorus ferrugineus]|uniref:Centrosomal protein of 78 kDa n=1 Tax=Rhynchophorus ferrugineus TaxID=354439 RepID=A0A834MK25_RHYFE|nr:hypothetical protein GWI33_003444 [Rhynchophorus ferrugineus]
MDKTKSSVVKANPKPVSVFYVWYSELCRRLNINPASCVKPAKPKCQTVLDFVADRLKVEDWNPVINALRQDTSLHVIAVRSKLGNCQFLHEADTEEKARNIKRKYGSIWTAYVLKQLLKSLSFSLRSTQVLTYLELEGLPLFMQYLEPLMQALKKNKTLKSLSFANCFIHDTGCQLVCSYLRFTPNIEILNLSGCNLSPVSGEHIAKLIKYQQINRYCESWHSSLRYENPDAGKMRGIKRITLNCNMLFGDAGLNFVLDELEDDLWVKALDLQKCGFTENITNRILDVLEYNKTLEIVDLRRNDLLCMATVEKVLQILKQRQPYGLQTEFQWCATAASLTWSSIYSTTSKTSFATACKSVHKTKSAPIKSVCSKVSAVTWDQNVRKTKTTESINRGLTKLSDLKDTKKQVLELNDKLQKEIQKRKEIEKKNEELQSQLNQIKTSTHVPSSIETTKRFINEDSKKVDVRTNNQKEQYQNHPMVIRRKEGKNHDRNECTKEINGKQIINKVNGVKRNISNGCKKILPKNNMYNMLEKLLNSGQPLIDNVEYEMIDYLKTTKINNESYNHSNKEGSEPDSQVSLYKYMEQLQNDNT